MLKLSNILAIMAIKTVGLLKAERAPLMALAWVVSNVVLVWIGMVTKHPNLGGLTAGALDGAILSAIVLVKASARLEAGMTGLLSGFTLNSMNNGGRTVASFVHGVHEVLETVVTSSTQLPAGHHQELELMIMRAIWAAVLVMLLAFLVKWGQSPAGAAAAVVQPGPMLVPVAVPAVPTEIARGQAA
jgi:hypothetical protein